VQLSWTLETLNASLSPEEVTVCVFIFFVEYRKSNKYGRIKIVKYAIQELRNMYVDYRHNPNFGILTVDVASTDH
jgi:hypothetical protein